MFGVAISTVAGRLMITLAIGRRLPDLVHGVADLDREVELRAGEALGAVFEAPVRTALRAARSRTQRAACTAMLTMPGRSRPKTTRPLHGGRGVVQVHDRALRTAQRLERTLDQLRPSLRQHLHDDVVRDQAALDELAHEVEVSLRGRRETHLDFLEAGAHQQVEHAALAAASIGSISAWLPSRRSTLHHSGGAAITLSGQVRAARSIGANERYLFVGSCNILGIPVLGRPSAA
jgi:hypothetical protein